MCLEVVFPDGEEVGTAGGLRARWPRLVRDRHYKAIRDDACLCQVNIRKSAEANGWRVASEDNFCVRVEEAR